ncbi:MAG: hypothetical protein HC929_13755 [Leptolyngbyaceae cyanobacterium SM2_5_2]|nr:hypothetical protein [Leptolyngbyaceae cyanobacterium SM2_5_2]
MMIAPVPQSRSLTSLLKRLSNLSRHLTALSMLVAGCGGVGLALAAPAQAAPLTPAISMGLAQNAATSNAVFPAPGQYLFGQVPEPDQVGQGYIVMETTGDRVYGALYYPSSSFDCFQGQVQGNELAMTIINSYSQEAYPFSIALVADSTVAAQQLPDGLTPVSLSGFHAIDTLTDNDLRMLSVCKAAVEE